MKAFPHILLILLSLTAWGQEDKYLFTNLSTGDGLSQSSVIAIEQDRLGQIWLGTRDGLNKYDGNTFTVYRNDPDRPDSISNSDILSIKQDSQGYLWIGTYNGLNRYDPVKDSFKSYFPVDANNATGDHSVWSLLEMRDCSIWAGTSQGISVYNPNSDTLKGMPAYSEQGSPISLGYVKSIVQLADGSIWAGTSDGLCQVQVLDNGALRIKTFRPKGTEAPFYVQDILD